MYHHQRNLPFFLNANHLVLQHRLHLVFSSGLREKENFTLRVGETIPPPPRLLPTSNNSSKPLKQGYATLALQPDQNQLCGYI